MISDMLDGPASGNLCDTPIHLDAPASLISIYADLVYATRSLILDIQVSEYITLLGICDHMQSHGIEDLLIKSLHKSAADDPWATFVLAAKRDDLDLAKVAILHLDGKSNPATRFPCADVPNEFYEVAPNYLNELLYRRLLNNYMYPDRHAQASSRVLELRDWREVSRGFRPRKA
jgi:hypothetical protein